MRKVVRISHSLSRSTASLELCRRQLSGELLALSKGTGFFWLADGNLFLITNWHNVTGWDPINDLALSDNCSTPDVIRMRVALRERDAEHELIAWHESRVELYEQGTPVWLEHPVFGRKVDVVAIKFGATTFDALDRYTWIQPVNTYSALFDFIPTAGGDAAVIGYPLGIDGGGFPLWKRASIASEPDFDIEGLPKVLIDTATRKGMSGSPVIAINRGVTAPRHQSLANAEQEARILSGEERIGTAETFFGVYSGRLGDDPLGAQIGIVWKGHVVDAIVSGGVLGKTPFD